jgi:predicted nucleic acid-binding protein
MILLDTSALIACLTADRPAAPALAAFVREGHRVGVSTLVLYEWWRGPRTGEELADQEVLFPQDAAFPFGITEAAIAAEIFRTLRRPRARALDIAIAAGALAQHAALWTLNPDDFRDIPGLELAEP